MIEIHDLSKVYSNGKGIFDVTFKVNDGEVFGFLGPNGAGKTTTIRTLMGFTNPTKGYSTIDGVDTRKQSADIQRSLGYVPGEIAFFDNMTGYQFLNFIAEMRGSKDAPRRDELIQYFELDASSKIRKMSKGMKQKLGLIAAFMNDPKTLILDEPTSGLDPLMQKKFIELILSEKKRGKTILMSSHIFDEVDRTCERAAIIKDGKIVALDHLANLKSRLKKSYLVTLATEKDLEIIKQSGLEFRMADDLRVEIFISTDYQKMLSVLASCEVTSLDVAVQSLEQIFIGFYGKGV